MKRKTNLSIYLMVLAAATIFSIASVFLPAPANAQEQVNVAYISDSPGSSAPYWIAKDAGIFRKYGLEIDTVKKH